MPLITMILINANTTALPTTQNGSFTLYDQNNGERTIIRLSQGIYQRLTWEKSSDNGTSCTRAQWGAQFIPRALDHQIMLPFEAPWSCSKLETLNPEHTPTHPM